MGCWNGTCGISQMSIPAGEKVKCFLLLQSDYNGALNGAGQCYSTAYFRPWFFPVTAEYNDYGSIENIEMDWHAEYMLKTFQKWLADGTVKLLGDESEINSPDIDKFETLENVFDCVERGGLVFKSSKAKRGDGIRKIGIFMVLTDVYDSLVETGDKFLAQKEHDYIRKSYDEDMTAARKTVECARSPKDAVKDPELRSMIYSMNLDRVLGDLIEEHAAFKHYRESLLDPNGFDADKFFAVRSEVSQIESAMSYLRKYWIPQSGQGSQSEELAYTIGLIKGMETFISARQKQFAKWKAEEKVFMKKYNAELKAKKKAKNRE